MTEGPQFMCEVISLAVKYTITPEIRFQFFFSDELDRDLE